MARIFKITPFLFLLGVFPLFTHAASLSFLSSDGGYSVGDTFQETIVVDSENQSMNAASGVVSFPSDKLEIVSLAKNNSIINLWAQEPFFSNTDGTVNFEGIIPNPGFNGSQGKIITINFKAKTAGIAPITFVSGSVLANDGSGTNILRNLGSTRLSLGYAIPSVSGSVTPSSTDDTPSAPQISSATHPDPDNWYAKKDAKFSWSTTPDITGVRILAGKNPRAIPTQVYESPLAEKELTGLKDGIWYFSVQLRNSQGWGEVAHFRFQIDTEKPNHFDIAEIPREDTTEPRGKFILNATDEVSGIDYYEIQIGNKNPEIWKDDGSHQYTSPVLGPGEYPITVKVFDKAGNITVGSASFSIKGITLPQLKDYPKELKGGELLVVRGSTAPNGKVEVWVQDEKSEPKSTIVQSDKKGDFTFVADQSVKGGIYKFWAEAVDFRGAKSFPTEKLTIAVENPIIFRVGQWMVSFLTILTPLVALLLLLVITLWYGWRKFSILRRRLRNNVHHTESATHKAFNLIKNTIDEQVKMLEKTSMERKLTREESVAVKHLKQNLIDAEKFIQKELDDLKQEIKN